MPKIQPSSRLTLVSLVFLSIFILMSASNWGVANAQNRISSLALPEAARAVRIVSASGPVNTDVFVDVEDEAQASDTAGLQFSIHFNPAVLSISGISGVNLNPDITVGPGAPAGTAINVNAAGVAAGDIGIGLNFNGANTTPPTVVSIGTKRVVRFKFHVLPGAAVGGSPVTFTNTVVTKGVFDANGIAITPLPPFTDGSVTVTGARTLRIGSTSTKAGGTAVVPVLLTATGTEFGVSLTANWDPNLLSITGVLGTDVLAGATAIPANCTRTLNNTAVAQGRLGIGLGCPTGGIPAGIDELFTLKFTAKAAAVAGTQIPVTFGNTPINTEVGDQNGNTLTVDTVPGNITILGPTAALVSVAGRVTAPNGAGLRNVTVTMTDAFGTTRTATTSSFGFYQFDEVESGATYVMGVASRAYRFGSRSVSVTDNIVDMDFVGLE